VDNRNAAKGAWLSAVAKARACREIFGNGADSCSERAPKSSKKRVLYKEKY